MSRAKLQPLSDAERAELGAWLSEHKESLPQSVRAALEQHQALCEGLHGSRHKLSQVLFELRRALGIKAMSERRLSKDPLGPLAGGDRTRPKSERERLELDVTHLEALRAWHKHLVLRHGRKVKAIRRKLMKMPVQRGLEEYELSEEEKAECAAEAHEGMARFRLGGGAKPAFESSKEAFMTGAQVTVIEPPLAVMAPVR